VEAPAAGAQAAEEAPPPGYGLKGGVRERDRNAPAVPGALDAVVELPGDDTAHGGGAVRDGDGGGGAEAVHGGYRENGEEGKRESEGWCHWEGVSLFFFI